MSDIKFTAQQREAMVAKLQRYFDRELEQDLGQFDAEFLLDFIAKDMKDYKINYRYYINEANKILSSLGFKCAKDKKDLKVTVPTWRPDINLEEDLIEELIRIKGFDKIKLIKPEKNRVSETLNFKQKLFHLSQRALASKGYLETVTWSFTESKIDKQFSKEEKEISIFNPISSDLDVLRRSIFSNLAIYLKKNQDRGYEDLSFFEIGPTFFGKNPGEQQVVAGGLKSGKINR